MPFSGLEQVQPCTYVKNSGRWLEQKNKIKLFTDKSITFSLKFNTPLKFGHTKWIRGDLVIPFQTPLEGFRYWIAIIPRFTAKFSLKIGLPKGYNFNDLRVFEESDHWQDVITHQLDLASNKFIFEDDSTVNNCAIKIEFYYFW